MIADRMGRSRALVLTILTYALFTGLSFFAQAWWHLLIFRFLAALGIGGEWAVGASLLSETWPRRWRPWMAAVLQTGVNLGVMLASLAIYLLADFPYRSVFLVGVLPALLVLWIRRSVPEPEEWQDAQQVTGEARPAFADLFRGSVRRTTILASSVCGFVANWPLGLLFWYLQQLQQSAHCSATAGPTSKLRTSRQQNGLACDGVVDRGKFLRGLAARNSSKISPRDASLLCLGCCAERLLMTCMAWRAITASCGGDWP